MSGGSVNLSNLAVTGDGFGALNGPGAVFFIGVLYEESSGTVNQVMTWAQDNNSGNQGVNGWGIWIEGGSSNPSVTVENSSVHNFSSGGIFAIGETTAPDLTVAIKNNFVSSVYEGDNNIVVYQGTNPTVSGNTVIGGEYGIYITSPTGSITGKTFLGSQTGIALTADGPSVTSNNVYGATAYGIAVSATLKKSIVEKNTIRNVQSASITDFRLDVPEWTIRIVLFRNASPVGRDKRGKRRRSAQSFPKFRSVTTALGTLAGGNRCDSGHPLSRMQGCSD